MSLAARKRELRERLAAMRRMRPPSLEAADAATAVVVGTPEFGRSRSIALYAALPDELCTRALYRQAFALGKRVALPRTGADGTLAFAISEAFEDLRPGRYGVLEPPEASPPLALAEVDLVVVPGVAFDRRGGRLGRGGGHYDRALSAIGGEHPFRVGFAESVQVVGQVPMEELDQRVHAVATERELLRNDAVIDDPRQAE